MADGSIGRLVVEMSANLARFEAEMRNGTRIAENAFGQMTAAANTFRNVLGTIGAGVSFGALVSSFRTITLGLDELNDAADRTGTSIENLSSLRNTLAPFGTSLQQINDLTGKLVLAMSGADDELGKAAAAFRSLNVSTRDGSGNLRDSTVVLKEIADELAKYADGSNKAAIAQAIFKKSGAESLPLLKDLAEATRVGANVTREQAEQADKFAREVRKLGLEAKTAAEALVSSLIPAINQLLTRFNLARREGLGFIDALKTVPGANTTNQDLLRERRQEVDDKVRERNNLLSQEGRAIFQGDLGRRRFLGLVADLDAEIARRQRLVEVIRQQAQSEALALDSQSNLDARDLRVRGPGSLEQAPAQRDLAEEKRKREEAERLRKKAEEEAEKLAKERAELVLRNSPLSRLFDEDGAGVTERSREELRKWTEEQEKVAEVIRGRLNPALAEFEARRKEIDAAINLSPEDRQAALEQAAAAFKRATDEANPYLQMLKRLRDVYGEILTPAEQWLQTMKEIALLEREGTNSEQIGRLRAKAGEDYARAMEKASDSTAKARDVATELSLVMTSAADKALEKWEVVGNLLQAILKDAAKLAYQQVVSKPLGDLIGAGVRGVGALFSGGRGTDQYALQGGNPDEFYAGRAIGGPVTRGTPYMVGERGPELFVPSQSGTIVPNGSMGGATYYIDARGADPGQLMRLENMIRASNGSIESRAASSWRNERAKGGSYARA